MNALKPDIRPSSFSIGRAFVHPLFDVLVIGGGLSLLLTAFVMFSPERGEVVNRAALPWFMLLSNSAHFAASTVRLYTKPGASNALPFLTFSFPVITLLTLVACLSFAGSLGPQLQAIYLTWSPYHYAAQAYGLAVMYCFRSGCLLEAFDKKLLWWVSMLPFGYAFVGDLGSGLHWVLPASAFEHPFVALVHAGLVRALPIVSFLAIAALCVRVAISKAGAMPGISVLMLMANAAWWCLLPQQAFVWATIFHGLQYLAIVTIFHVQDQMKQPSNRRGRAFHVMSFYGMSLLLGYGLFSCLPWTFELAGFGMVESISLVVAVINIHHFIVDAYIWRLKKGDGNRAIVDARTSADVVMNPATTS